MLFCLLPQHAELIAWVFAAAVAVTVVQRVALGVHLLAQPVPVLTEPSADRRSRVRPLEETS